MKIPKYIEKAIKQAGKTTKINRDNSEIIRNWLEENNMINNDSDDLTDEGIIDYVIDSVESGRDGSDSLIEYLKRL